MWHTEVRVAHPCTKLILGPGLSSHDPMIMQVCGNHTTNRLRTAQSHHMKPPIMSPRSGLIPDVRVTTLIVTSHIGQIHMTVPCHPKELPNMGPRSGLIPDVRLIQLERTTPRGNTSNRRVSIHPETPPAMVPGPTHT